jgi:hypothetical protein
LWIATAIISFQYLRANDIWGRGHIQANLSTTIGTLGIVFGEIGR